MALVRQIRKAQKERNTLHELVACSYAIFSRGGRTYLQLDTYGSKTRKLKGKVSQSVQFDRESAAQLKRLIEEAFPGLT